MSKTTGEKIFERGRLAGIAKAKAERYARSVEIGKVHSTVQISLRLLEKNMDIEFVAEVSKLRIELLQELKLLLTNIV